MNTHTWYSKEASLDSPDTLHQILAFGTLDELKELKKEVGEQKLKEIFITYPKKIYTPQSLSFIKKFILHITRPIDDNKYFKHTPRYTR